eukprot:1993933-Amphidinium_carterae.1
MSRSCSHPGPKAYPVEVYMSLLARTNGGLCKATWIPGRTMDCGIMMLALYGWLLLLRACTAVCIAWWTTFTSIVVHACLSDRGQQHVSCNNLSVVCIACTQRCGK